MISPKIELDNKERFISEDKVPMEAASTSPFERFENIALSGNFTAISKGGLKFSGNKSRIKDLVDEEEYNKFKDSHARSVFKDLLRMPDNPYLINNCAKSLLNNGEYEQAIDLFRQAIEKKPDFTIASLNLATALELNNKDEEAVKIYNTLLSKNPNDVRALSNLGNIHFKNKNIKEARKFFDMILKIDANNVTSLDRLAIINLVEGDFRKSIAYLKRCTQLNANLPAVYNNLGVAYAVSKNFRKAVDSFKISLKLFPAYVSSIINLAMAYKSEGKVSEGIELLENYLKNAENYEVQEILARFYMKSNNPAKSLHILKEILLGFKRENYPKKDIGRLLNNIGVICHKTLDLISAEKYYSESFQEAGYVHSALVANLIDLHFDLRKTNIIPEYISILKERFSGENLHYYYEAKYKYSEGELDAAIKLFHASIEKKPNFSPAYIMLSFVYAECLKDYDNAIKFGEIANNKFRANVAIVNNLAYAYLMKNEVSKAGSVLQEVLENKNKNFCLIATIGLLRIKEGDIQEGSSLYNLASKIAPTEYFKKVVLQKKNLELAKYYLDNGDERRAKELLIKAVSMKQSDTFYYEDAKELLSKID